MVPDLITHVSEGIRSHAARARWPALRALTHGAPVAAATRATADT
jgi:hypothetical protein